MSNKGADLVDGTHAAKDFISLIGVLQTMPRGIMIPLEGQMF